MSRRFSISRILPLLFLAFMPVAAFAQAPAAPKVNLIIERNLLRFETPGEARVWRVEVFNQTGELVFASGQVSASALEWSLQDQLDKPLASGLYAYTLTALNENGETSWTQRGHVIIDRASASDRIWVASGNAIGVGSASELTVAGSPEATVGGAKLLDVAAPSRTESNARSSEAARAANASTGTQQIKPPVQNAIGVVTADGTAGRIAKFIGANAIDNSVMTEAGGNIQVGTNSNLARLTAIHTNVRGIYGRSDSAAGVWGQSLSSNGVYGYSSTGNGAYGYSLSGWGVLGLSISNHGVYGSTSGAGVAGVFGSNGALNSRGIWGSATNGADATGVYGESTDGRGVFGQSQTNSGVRGESASGTGVYGFSTTGRGVYGVSNSYNGVSGRTDAATHSAVAGQNTNVAGIGVHGIAASDGNEPNSIGVWGEGDIGVQGNGSIGVAGYGSLGPAIFGQAALAGQFIGNVNVMGNLSKSGGSFKIDHPLDPANKYLYHSFVESPDMMNIYNGNVTTDANGEAVVTLPDYFSALNRDFRYQLTVVGQFAQAIVGSKIEGNRFTIKTDKPNVEVSWQVTGVRQDAFANAHRIPNEEAKTEKERGYYLHPELFGQPEEKGVEWARHPEMMKRIKAERAERKASPQQ